MKTYEKYCEAVMNWALKKIIAVSCTTKPGYFAKCAYFEDELTKMDYYTDNFCAYGIPKFYNALKTNHREIIQLSRHLLDNRTDREIQRTQTVEIVSKGKKRLELTVFETENGEKTFINSEFLKIIDKYPHNLKYTQKAHNTCVYVIDTYENSIIAMLMPINRNAMD